MSEPDPLTAFFLMLDEHPGDSVTLLALADWYEEQGRPEGAACVRWVVRNVRYPFRYRRDGGLSVSGVEWHDGWYWWALDDPYAGQTWGHPLHCRLPHRLWNRLKHSFKYEPAVFKEYASQRQAYEALLEAWPSVGPLIDVAPREARA
jgi:uncharacterized protein (TIGR02996 family)